MKEIIAERVECAEDDIPDAIVIGIERNDENGYEKIWMDPDDAIEFANDIIRLSHISIYRFSRKIKKRKMRKIRKSSVIKIVRRK